MCRSQHTRNFTSFSSAVWSGFTPLIFSSFFSLFLAAILMAGCSRKQTAPPPDGNALFAKRCASCHDPNNDMRAPTPQELHEMSKDAIFAALDSGRMRWEAKFLSKAQKKAVADAVGAQEVSTAEQMTGFCPRDLDPPANPPGWAGWGADLQNTRFQPAAAAGLKREDVKNLKLKWAFGFPGAAATYGQPTAYNGRLFVGSEDGNVYALDSATGCVWWRFKASETVKTAISIGNQGTTAFFGDTNGYIYAVKFSDGSLLWKQRPELHPAARITGSPLLVGNRLFVPISSGEEGSAADPSYPCCTFRGSVVALDTKSGRQIWRTYTVAEVSKPTRKNSQGVQYFGPSGVAVWSSPTADLKRRIIYVSTGNNYSDPPTPLSDSVVALGMDSGKRLWSRQFTARDLWNAGCVAEKKDNCPQPHGDDFDFGAPPLLISRADGHDLLLLAQKSGMIYALDPDHRGAILWSSRISKGGPLGGIEWGGAAGKHHVYFTVSDYDFDHPLVGGGLFSLDLLNGQRAWYVPPPVPPCVGQVGCSPAQMAPPTLIPGAVFAGSLDGHLRAYDTRDGSVLWDFNTTQDFHTTNGVKAHGGGLNGAGPAIVSGIVYVNAGYTNAMPGNVLLAFSAK
jgi:polyvinyl alcohol dehydrogenase (cytochrome)